MSLPKDRQHILLDRKETSSDRDRIVVIFLRFINWLYLLPRRILILIINGYRVLLSPDHSFWARAMDKPPFCKHFPSCSSYSVEALEKHGVMKGGFYTIRRILSCNPWSKGGFDPVPSHSNSHTHV